MDKSKVLIVLFLLCVSLFVNVEAQNRANVIPYPKCVALQKGIYRLKDKAYIQYRDFNLKNEANFLKDRLSDLNYPSVIKYDKKSGSGIFLKLKKDLKDDEAYVLSVSPKCIIIEGKSPAGVFYGIETLLQELTNGGIRYGKIIDAPRYKWRGYMLDEARHFFGKKKVEQILDIMAYFKLNKFHWHLSDEQGWRIEIKEYPRLATVGGIGCCGNPNSPAKYYTQQDIKEVVRYANERHIDVIPEIDMPGHATAANKAYPMFSGGGTTEHPDFTFNVGKDSVYTFLSNILKEITTLFPSKYLHIGGDEVAFGSEAWKTNTDIQKLMEREHLQTVKDAESYFMHRMSDSIRILGKTQVGWDELLDLGLDPRDVVIMWWRHDKPDYLKNLLSKGYSTVLCPRKPLYFDFVQYKDHKCGRLWDGFCPIEDIYSFPDKLLSYLNVSEVERKNIRGIQANLWTESIQNTNRLDFMTFPRLCALAESAWSDPRVKDYNNFKVRMENVFTLFDKKGIYYFDYRNPARHPEPIGPVKK